MRLVAPIVDAPSPLADIAESDANDAAMF